MAYVENGVVKQQRSVWRLRFVLDLFWSMVGLIVSFFKTMFSMDATESYKKSGSRRGTGGGWGSGPGGGGPGPGPGGNGPRRPPRGMDNVRGIDHSSLPACGSCCGG